MANPQPTPQPHDGYKYEENYITGIIGKRLTENVHNYRQHLVGRILTIIDAAIQDAEQRKAVKDLIQSAVYHQGAREAIHLDYILGSLSKVLRDRRTEGTKEETEQYKAYAALRDFEGFGNIIEEPLRNAELG